MYKKIGIIREGKVPPDRRVPLTPDQCARVQKGHPNVDIVVQRSPIRAFNDEEYEEAGIRLVDDLDDRELIMGVKEVPMEVLLPNKSYLFFSHTTKGQPYNMPLLQAILDKGITLMDLELLENEAGQRVVAFGRWAGIVGAYNAFRTWHVVHGHSPLKSADACHDRKEMEAKLQERQIPNDLRVVMTGTGRVAGGAEETLRIAGLEKVEPEELFMENNDRPIYCTLDVADMYRREDGKPFDKKAFYDDPTGHRSLVGKAVQHAHMFITAHFWDARGPMILSQDDLVQVKDRLKVVADISCDIDGPIACTLRPSTIADPFYGYDPEQHHEVSTGTPGSLAVMAVDNLPCELPRDSSMAFGEDLMTHMMPAAVGVAPSMILDEATIVKNGALTPAFQYLADHLTQASIDDRN